MQDLDFIVLVDIIVMQPLVNIVHMAFYYTLHTQNFIMKERKDATCLNTVALLPTSSNLPVHGPGLVAAAKDKKNLNTEMPIYLFQFTSIPRFLNVLEMV